MCFHDKKEGCQKPENLKGRPQDCTAEQIRECHGDLRGHPCLPGKKEHPVPKGHS